MIFSGHEWVDWEMNPIGNTRIHIPQPFSKKLTRYQQQKQKKAHGRRAAIEPITGHLKQDHRLSRNFYKGDFGDAIHVLLAAAAFNVKRMMNRYKEKWSLLWEQIKATFFSLPNIMPLFKERLITITIERLPDLFFLCLANINNYLSGIYKTEEKGVTKSGESSNYLRVCCFSSSCPVRSIT